MRHDAHPRRSGRGLSLIEALVALLMVTMAAMLLARVSSSNSAARMQSAAASTAVRLASEFAEWTRRDGHRQLGMPLGDALAQAAGTLPNADCRKLGCDARQAAWHYLASWRARIVHALPGAQFLVCSDDLPRHTPATWSCRHGGAVLVLKIRARHLAKPVAVDLGIRQ